MATRRPWSTGCHSCRKMKVKCDETKPACRRCTRADRHCPGYRQDSQMMFRSMNSWAQATHPQQQPVINYRPATDWNSFAISRFLHHFVLPSTNSSLGHLAFLPQLLRSGGPSQALHEAVLASALANLANVSGMTQLQIQSQVHFGQALQSLRAALGQPSTAVAEETLAVVPVIQIYEVIAGITPRIPSQDPHEAGAARILHQKWEAQPDKKPRSNVEGLVQAKLGIHSLFGHGGPAAAAPRPVNPRGFNPWAAANVSSSSPTDNNNSNDNNNNNNDNPDDDDDNFKPWVSKLWPWLLQVPVYCGKLRAKAQQVTTTTTSQQRDSSPSSQAAARAAFRSSLHETWSFYSTEGVSRSRATTSLRPSLLSSTSTSTATAATDDDPEGKSILTAMSWMLYWCSCVQLLQTLIESHALFMKLPPPPDHNQNLEEEEEEEQEDEPFSSASELSSSSSSETIFSSSSSSSSRWKEQLENDLISAVRNICAAGPFLLGDNNNNMYSPLSSSPSSAHRCIGAFFLLRGLKTANSVRSETLPLHDRKVILDYLSRISSGEFGIKLAGRARDDWLASHPVEADAFSLVGGRG